MKIGINQDKTVTLNLKMANRHGLITGATGTGKTVTLKVLAEQFSDMGVPVFMQDVKGDLTGFIEAGAESTRFKERLELIGVDHVDFKSYPTTFWDIFGEQGHPIRTTISDMGPLMLTKLLKLNDVQTSVLYTIFKFADENGLLLLDFKDFLEIIQYISVNKKVLGPEYHSISGATLGAIQRKLVVLEQEGIEHFFGEPALDIKDLMVTDNLGRGMINVLEASKLSSNPNLYSTFLLWLLSELFEELEEVGDTDKPRLVFFFDEAHLIFKGMSSYLLEKFEQVVKLIRSKGVGVYFITQNPTDIPDSILGQLGNRIQHALKAYTPKDKKAVRVAAQTFRQNEAFDTEEVITNLGLGEALVSFLDEKAVPSVVERVYIMPPQSKIGPVKDPEVLEQYIQRSYLGGKYNTLVDRESAYELLTRKAQKQAEKIMAEEAKAEKDLVEKKAKKKKTKKRGDSPLDKFFKSTASALGSQFGKQLIRGILGSLKK